MIALFAVNFHVHSIRQFYMKRAARLIRYAEGLGKVCHVDHFRE